MGKTESYQHPMLVNAQKIKENGIVVFDNIRGLPPGKELFTSPDYVICIVHHGYIRATYNDHPDSAEEHTAVVIFPNHSLREVSKSDDYLATLVVANASMLNDPMLRIIDQMRYRYEPCPRVKLDHEEYTVIMQLVGVMRETTSINIPDKRLLLTRQLGFFMRLLSYYRTVKLNESPNLKHVSTQFQNNLVQHFRDHRNVGFYAAKACLSTKYFSTVIYQETGHTAAWWIHSHVVAEAKALLLMRRDLNIQTVANQLGFPDQATFCRFFKRQTGLTPTDYRVSSE